MRYLITFSYNGKYFNGYQRQKGNFTVQQRIEDVLTDINKGFKVEIKSSSRTDKGVHARVQKAHFDMDVNIPLTNLKRLLNKQFEYIYIKDVEVVDDSFHARYNVKYKTYKYFINTGEYSVFNKDYIYQYNKQLDINKMNKALKLLRGTNDYRSFCKDEKEFDNCIRTIYDTSIKKNNDIIEITITGDGFLRHMIRNIVGCLIAVGTSKISVDDFNEIFLSKDRTYNIKKAPSSGLYLWDIKY